MSNKKRPGKNGPRILGLPRAVIPGRTGCPGQSVGGGGSGRRSVGRTGTAGWRARGRGPGRSVGASERLGGHRRIDNE
jgi:hypothetical protein